MQCGHCQAKRTLQILLFLLYVFKIFLHSMHYCVLNIKTPQLFDQTTLHILKKLENELSISSKRFPLPMFQVDTLEVIRHPEETTNMKRQTMASYFRVRSLLDLCPPPYRKDLSAHKRPRFNRVIKTRAKHKSQLEKVGL